MAACLLPQRLYDARSPLADGIWNSSLCQQLAMLQAGHCWQSLMSPPHHCHTSCWHVNAVYLSKSATRVCQHSSVCTGSCVALCSNNCTTSWCKRAQSVQQGRVVEADMDLPRPGIYVADRAELFKLVHMALHSAANLALDARINDILIRSDSAQPLPVWHAPVDATCHVAVADSEGCMQQPKP